MTVEDSLRFPRTTGFSTS